MRSDDTRMEDMFLNDKMTYYDIADVFGVSGPTIYRRIGRMAKENLDLSKEMKRRGHK